MEHNKFIQRLEELAVVKRIKAPKSAKVREADTACDIFRNGETHIIDKDNNSTWAYEVKQVKALAKSCEDCLQIVKGRRVTKALYISPQIHWRTTCTNCNRVRDPTTGQFEIMPHHAHQTYIKFFNKQNK